MDITAGNASRDGGGGGVFKLGRSWVAPKTSNNNSYGAGTKTKM